jgi:hypothetical protein
VPEIFLNFKNMGLMPPIFKIFPNILKKKLKLGLTPQFSKCGQNIDKLKQIGAYVSIFKM